MIRRIKSCQLCNRRFTTASGASQCLPCRSNSTDNAITSSTASVSTECKSSNVGQIDQSSLKLLDPIEKCRVELTTGKQCEKSTDIIQAANVNSRVAAVDSYSIPTNPCENNNNKLNGKRLGAEHELIALKKPRLSDESTDDILLCNTNEQENCKHIKEEADCHQDLLTQSFDDGDNKFGVFAKTDTNNMDPRTQTAMGIRNSFEVVNSFNALVQLKNENEQESRRVTLDTNSLTNKINCKSEQEKGVDDCNFDYESVDEDEKYNPELAFASKENIGEEGQDSDDDSEIICWDASDHEPFSCNNGLDSEFNRDARTDSMAEAAAAAVTQQPIADISKDVCYICGSDLSKLSTGIKGRVAHMKRCSAKNGKLVLGNDDIDLVDSGDKDEPPIPLSTSNGAVSNPYSKDQWHGDASLDLLETSSNATIPRSNITSKQTALDKYFKGPVRSLTSVLMAGSKRLAKSKSIEEKSKADTTAKPRGKWGGGGGGGGSWRSQNRGNCPGYKKIPGTDFICDGFHYASHTLSNNYFLTHFHSDHYGGITKQWNEGTIYCSVPTATLVNEQLGVEKRWLHPLPMNTPIVVESKGKPITVTLLDANHCPGAVMFLFEVRNKRILHVGDFRWNNSIMMGMPQLRAFSNMKPRLDEIFLDTTYCDPKYTLPTQDAAIAAAIKVVKYEMATANMMGTKSLLLFGSYTIGKEKIYLSVAKHLKAKVYVDKRRYKILSALEWPKEQMALFTTVKSESYLWVVPLGHVNFKKMPEYLDDGNKNKSAFAKPYGRVVGFRPTGWTYSTPKKSMGASSSSTTKQHLISSKTSGRFSVHGVPYSEHSSFPELVDCLRCLKPKKITTTVSVSKSEEQCQMLLDAVNNSPD